MIEDLYKDWIEFKEVDGVSDFILQFNIKLEEAKDLFLEGYNLKDIEKYLDGDELNTENFWRFLLEDGMCDQDFIEAILENRQCIYYVTYITERHRDYFKIYKKVEEE